MKKATAKNGILAGVMATLFFLGVAAPAAAQVEGTVVALRGEIHVQPEEGSLLARPAMLEVTGVTVPEALALLSTSANVSVAFSPSFLPGGLRVDCSHQDATIAEALDCILSGTEFGYLELGDQIVIAKRAPRETLESLKRLPVRIVEASRRLPSELTGVSPQNGSSEPRAQRLQETGVITGRVTEAGTGRSLSGVQVAIDGAQRGSLTNDEGRYMIAGVPAGTRSVRAILLGFREERSSVAVRGGETVVVDFALQQAVIRLDELVVTVTGDQRRREIGNVIGRIAATDSLVATAPINTLTELLTGRVSGLQVMNIDGLVGSSPTIRIRGLSSMSMSNDPIVIIDGVRISNQTTGSAGFGRSGGRLNDIIPSQIESIEVVKGPSAATLYGTDAANGVIIITTKRGTAGPARWTAFAEFGASEPARRFPDNYHSWGTNAQGAAVRCEPHQAAGGACAIDSLSVHNPLQDHPASPIGTGYRHQVGIQVQGGSGDLNYFLSAFHENDVGYFRLPSVEQARLMAERGTSQIPDEQIRPNWAETLSLRSNTGGNFGNVNLALSVGLIQGNRQIPSPAGIISPGELGQGFDNPETFGGWRDGNRPGETFAARNTERFTRFTGGLRTMWDSGGWLSVRSTIGLDLTNSELDALQRFGEGTPVNRDGRRRNTSSSIALYTADFGASATFDLSPALNSRTSVGVQYNRTLSQSVFVSGTGLPPGAESIRGATVLGQNESDNETIVAGTYLEQLIGFRDRLFLSGAIRLDGGSSFGQDFQVAVYPKSSISWVAIDRTEQHLLTSLRLRGAYGASGVQPGATDALALYQIFTAVVHGSSGAAGRLNTLGNPNLKPERQREIEGGFDAQLHRDRIGLEMTYYDRLSKDALIQQPLPSDVAINSRWVNIGSVRNRGVEGSLSVLAAETPTYSWDFSLNGSWNRNRLEKHGLSVEALGNLNFRHVEGYPLFGRWARPVTYSDENGDGIIEPHEITVGDEPEFIGPSIPPRELSFATGVNLFNNLLRVSSLFEHRGGHTVINTAEVNRCFGAFANCRAANDPSAPHFDQARLVAFREENTWWGYIEDATFTRWRELSLSISIPQRFLHRLGSERAVLSVAGRNLALFTSYTGRDPEVDASPGMAGREGSFDNPTVPQTRYWTLRLTVDF